MQLEKKPLQGFIYSLMIGILASGIGLLLSVIIIGIPILILGIVIILASPVLAFFVKFADCPNCQAKLVFLKDNTKCRKCKKQLIVTNNLLELA